MDRMGQVCHGVPSIRCSLIHLSAASPASLHLFMWEDLIIPLHTALQMLPLPLQ